MNFLGYQHRFPAKNIETQTQTELINRLYYTTEIVHIANCCSGYFSKYGLYRRGVLANKFCLHWHKQNIFKMASLNIKQCLEPLARSAEYITS